MQTMRNLNEKTAKSWRFFKDITAVLISFETTAYPAPRLQYFNPREMPEKLLVNIPNFFWFNAIKPMVSRKVIRPPKTGFIKSIHALVFFTRHPYGTAGHLKSLDKPSLPLPIVINPY